MSERKLYQQFREKMLKRDPNCWVYKIPDFIIGGKRPADFFLLIQGVPYLIEMKSKNGQLTKYQAYQLQDFILAGGEALVFWESRETMDEFIKKIMEKVKERRQ